MPDRYFLMETEPAQEFEDAHLLGNGALGASVYGGVPCERILINHDTLWSGQEKLKVNPGTKANFEKARALTLEGKLKEANNLINDEMLGFWSESFMPLGHLNIEIGHKSDQRSMPQRRVLLNEESYQNYVRKLMLDSAVSRIEYDQHGRHYTREIFLSYPDGVMAVRLTAQGGALDFSLSMDSPLKYEMHVEENGVGITGRAPDRVEPYQPRFRPVCAYLPDEQSDSLRMAAHARVALTDGCLQADGLRVYVTGASFAVILMSANTNYAGYQMPRNNDATEVLRRCRAAVDAAAQKSYDALLHAHIQDYQSLYGRVSIDLGQEITGSLPTSSRLGLLENVDDPSLMALVLQYNRYLLIASSRPGTQAANLQGIWNPSLIPSWASNYTTNINIQMNYWGAEALALPECHLPMADLLRELSHSGQAAAQALYGMEGWVTHHNTDLWRMATLAGEDASWSWWPFGGAWMCQHLWEHYAYTQDDAFLRDVAAPILLGAAKFLCNFVVKDEQGHYVTPPSTSPENKFFIGETTVASVLEDVTAENRFSPNRADVSAIAKASTMDIALVRDVLTHCAWAYETLGMENPIASRIEEVLSNLPPFQIGKYGQLTEWEEDYEECTPGMGHVSHLYTAYPSNLISQTRTPELYKAAHLSIQRRMRHGGNTTGWPGSWALCLNARFLDGFACQQGARLLGQELGAGMLTQKTWQIDCILGWGAGLSEMLLQSHQGFLHLLPAIAPGWVHGRVEGLCARGGYRVCLKWDKGRLESAQITAQKEGPCRIRYQDADAEIFLKAGQTAILSAELIQIL